MDAESIRQQIAEFHQGRKWILVSDAAAGATAVVDQLREWDPAGIMVVAAVAVVGELPKADGRSPRVRPGETAAPFTGEGGGFSLANSNPEDHP